jgi:DNA (cytosine-5)-methyltransferase 1
MRKKSVKVKYHIVTRNSPLVTERIKTVPPGGNWEDIPRKLMQVDGKYSGIEKAHSMIYKRLRKKEPAITITNFRKGMIIHPTQDRLLSVREAARIQTFTDDYSFKGGLSSKQQQVADAVPVMLAKKVSESILKHLHQVIKIASA